MRSMKLLVAMAVLAAFVAGPVLAQEETTPPAGGESATSSDEGLAKTTTPSKGKHHKGKHHKKHGAGSAMPSTTTGK